MSVIEELFVDVDGSWKWPASHKIPLRIIGSAALMLQASYARGTKDSDVWETSALTTDTKKRLREIAGPGSTLHTKHRLYIDVVPNGLPFLPQAPRCHDLVDLSRRLTHFELEALDVVDVVVSKLKRFNAMDVSDIEAMVDRSLVPHEALIRRFQAAVDWFAMDARGEDLPKYVRNLHAIERDMFDVEETEIDLPGWV